MIRILLILLDISLLFSGIYAQNNIPRPEYPRPQFQRAEWINLNGEWSYAFDPGKTGFERDFVSSVGFEGQIIVPFCPESKLSGLAHKDFIEQLCTRVESQCHQEMATFFSATLS